MINKRKVNSKLMFYCIIIVYVGYILFKQQVYMNECLKQKKYYSNEIQKTEKASKELQHRQELYKSDSYIEDVARSKLGMVYPGEKIFKDISQ